MYGAVRGWSGIGDCFIMSRPIFLGFLILFLLLLGLAALRGTILALTIPLLVYLFHGLWRGPESLDLEIERTLSQERVAPETPVEVTVKIANQGSDLEELMVEDVLPATLHVSDGSPRHLTSLRRGESCTFAYRVQAPRGGFPFEGFRVRAGDQLGLLQVTKTIPTFSQLFVFPLVSRIKQVPIRPSRTRAYAGLIPARRGGAGVEFFGVRGYQRGDSPRHINWQVSARHEQDLYSNEFQQERVADVEIVLDGRQRTNQFAGDRSLFEHSVMAAGTLADSFLMQGDRVGLLVYGQYLQWTLPAYGKLQRERILHALSHAAPGASQVFEGLQHLPARVFPPESQVVLVSPLVEDDYLPLVQLRARRYRVMVVSPDPVSFEAGYLPQRGEVRLAARIVRMERRLLLRRLQRAGIQVVEWDVSEPFDQATRSAFSRQAGTGNRR